MLAAAAACRRLEQVEACSGLGQEVRQHHHLPTHSGSPTGTREIMYGSQASRSLAVATVLPIILNSAAFSYGFAIVDVFYEERSLHVVDRGKLELLHALTNSCAPYLEHLRQAGRPFTISPGSLGLVLYSCPGRPARRDPGARRQGSWCGPG
ncbi:hypothetical protein ZWY2020_031667 [Hordeum vulgare]|nr:hypothetical protein ZWY2020_031667 [Hordeum vulgare]